MIPAVAPVEGGPAGALARRAVEAPSLEVLLDERLRERDLGRFDGMTGAGIRSEFAVTD